MSRDWGVDRLTGLGRTFEAIALAEVNLSILTSKVNDLDAWNDHLPVNELQAVRETAARIRPLRDELAQILFHLGDRLHCADYVCDEAFSEQSTVNGKPVTWTPFGQFNRKHFAEYVSKLVNVLAKAESLAVELNLQAQTLVKVRYPAYVAEGDRATSMSGYGEGHLMMVQNLDDSEETGELSEVLLELVNYGGEDASNIRYLRSYVEEEQQALSQGLSATPNESVEGEQVAAESVGELPV